MYKKAIAEKFGLMLHLKELMKKDGEAFKVIVRKLELEDKSAELSRKYRDADDNEKTSIEKELTGILTELFSLRQKESQLKADRMEKDLKHMREVISEREKNKDIIIKDGLDKLTGKAEYLEW